MPDSKYFSHEVNVFHGRRPPEHGKLAGYSALIQYYNLQVPIPDLFSIISSKRRKYETDEWRVFTPRHQPHDTLYAHLTFALKYEGIELGVLKALYKQVSAQEITDIIKAEPTGQYTRRIWFLYEWLMDTRLPLVDVKTGNFVELVNENLQYGSTPKNSSRHRVRNNLPGVKDFCPMVRKTSTLENFIALKLDEKVKQELGKIHADVLARAASFLLLKDSKASYAIEGESPPQNRAQRWGKAIGQAGQKKMEVEELLRLQQIVIDNPRFVKMGWREQGGFVGEHDRTTGTPMPDHISAPCQDVAQLIHGLTAVNDKLEHDSIDAVVAAAMVAFGFVFIHPFVDGNGRIHRYLIHHVLARKDFVSRGIIFPVSAVILERIDEYRQVLEAYSLPRLELIDWKPTDDHNIEVTNDTLDLYRYFDATRQTEFLYSCIQQTVEKTIPQEVAYLKKYDRMKSYLDDRFEMPDKTVALLIRFLEQGQGILSERAKAKEFQYLKEDEVKYIEDTYRHVFGN